MCKSLFNLKKLFQHLLKKCHLFFHYFLCYEKYFLTNSLKIFSLVVNDIAFTMKISIRTYSVKSQKITECSPRKDIRLYKTKIG